eukprot:m.184828 g.184828  ORF g.184828 m.184828 type:complete len:66 (+) comp24710_c0_seq3:2220-2417(+)
MAQRGQHREALVVHMLIGLEDVFGDGSRVGPRQKSAEHAFVGSSTLSNAKVIAAPNDAHGTLLMR